MKRRITLPNIPHHVTQRGNRRQRVFFTDEDYRSYIENLRNAFRAYGVRVLAWCLMPNHVHLIVVPSDEWGLSVAMRYCNRVHAVAVNERHGWRGCLWQSRFHSFFMSDRHLMAALAYVELNPVRAGLCASPEDYPWSSAKASLAGTVDPLVGIQGARAADVGAGRLDEETLGAFRRCSDKELPMADEAMIREVEQRSGVRWIPRPPGRPRVRDR